MARGSRMDSPSYESVNPLAHAALTLLVAAVGFLSGCSWGTTSGKSAQPAGSEAVPVTVATVTQSTVPIELQAIGTVEAYSTVMVKSQIEGTIDQVYFKEGQDVSQGDRLFSIDSRPYEAALKQAEASLARDQAQEKNAHAQADRYTKLVEAGIVSKEQYDQFQTNADALEASVNVDKAAIENSKVQLGYCSIRSPLAGRTGSLLVHQGNLLKANDATLVTINQVTPIYVDFGVPEQFLSELRRYQALGPLRVTANIPNTTEAPPTGTVSFFDNMIDSATGTIRLKGVFPNLDKRLWPGQFVNVVTRLTSRPDAIVVPSQAVQTGQEGQYVFVVKSDHTAESRPVVVDRTVGAQTVIQKGLSPGEVVVTDGQLRLAPGTKVQFKNTEEGS
jgi:multidrug efflux system membrane fusion protein